jgi:hypothetical protein
MNENFSGAAAQSGIHPSANAGESEPKKLSDALEAASGESQTRMSQVGVNLTGLNQIDDRELEIGDSEDGHDKSNKQPTPSSLLLSQFDRSSGPFDRPSFFAPFHAGVF